MNDVKISGLPTPDVMTIRNSGKDANGHPLEVHVSDGNGNPCRHCLGMIREGEEYYVLSHRPFSTIQPYAEQGPIFLHKKECAAYQDDRDMPEALTNKETLIMRGYDRDERIVYGAGKIVPVQNIRQHASDMLAMERVGFVHLRSASNNCYQARMDLVNQDN